MTGGNLDEKDKGLRLVVKFFLQNASGSLHISLGGCRKQGLAGIQIGRSMGIQALTVQDNLQLLQESLLIHDV